MTPPVAIGVARPRIEGEREQQILAAALDVLGDVGYDRLTMDAVAARARASKATLYRRWTSKVSLVIEALQSMHAPASVTDTGTLRGDLMSLYCGMGGLGDEQTVSTFAAVITAISRDPGFAEAFRRDCIGPKMALSRQAWERAAARGELAEGLDISLFEPALAGIVMNRLFVLGEAPDVDLVARVIDQIILPAALRHPEALPRPKDLT